MSHHRIALLVVAAAAVLDVALGVAFAAADHVSVPVGLYFAVATATTVGYGDVVPRGWLPHLLAIMMMLTVVPLFAATFSLFTSGLTAVHVRREVRLARHYNAADPYRLPAADVPPGVEYR